MSLPDPTAAILEDARARATSYLASLDVRRVSPDPLALPLLARRGWDVESRGLFGAPALRVVVGDEVHVSLLKALSLLGLGRDRVERVPTDSHGRMRAESLPALDDGTILCLQAGNVNTGAF